MKCYLCSTEAKDRTEQENNIPNITIECPNCGNYTITFKAFHLFFENRDNLTIEDKNKLSNYVKDRSKDQKEKPIENNIKIIEVLTGKRSINSR